MVTNKVLITISMLTIEVRTIDVYNGSMKKFTHQNIFKHKLMMFFFITERSPNKTSKLLLTMSHLIGDNLHELFHLIGHPSPRVVQFSLNVLHLMVLITSYCVTVESWLCNLYKEKVGSK